MRKARGHVRPYGAGYEVAVPVGRDPITKRYTYAYAQAATLEEAEAVRERMLAARQAGRELRDKATFDQLLDAVLEVAHLGFNTRVIYQGYIDRTIRPALGDYEVGYLEQHPELLDRLYARLGRCRRLCGRNFPGEEIHHMPAVDSYACARGIDPTLPEMPYGQGPEIQMEAADHALTASYKNSAAAMDYLQTQADLIAQGRIDEAIQMDINNVQTLFPGKYDAAIDDMVNALPQNPYYQALRTVPSPIYYKMRLF
jgi:hypothetical protein